MEKVKWESIISDGNSSETCQICTEFNPRKKGRDLGNEKPDSVREVILI